MALTSLLFASISGRRPMRLLRWAERLNQYNVTFVSRLGKDKLVQDLLARGPIPSTADLPSATPHDGTASSY